MIHYHQIQDMARRTLSKYKVIFHGYVMQRKLIVSRFSFMTEVALHFSQENRLLYFCRRNVGFKNAADTLTTSGDRTVALQFAC